MQFTRSNLTSKSLLSMPIAWLIVPVLFYLSAHGSFSFQEVGGHTSDSLAQIHTESETMIGRIQRTALWPVLLLAAYRFLPGIWRTAKQTKWLSVLIGVACVSILWSQFPTRTLVYGVILCLNTGFGYYLIVRFDRDQQMKLVIYAGFAVALLSAVMAIFFPYYGLNTAGLDEWKGIFHTKNVCARALIFLLTPALHFRRRTAAQMILVSSYTLVVVGVIVMTRSRTGWIITLVYLTYALFIENYQKFNKRNRTVLIATSLGLLSGIIFLFSDELSRLPKLLGKDLTLTGRTDIWQAVIEAGIKRPFLGYGYAGFYNGMQGEIYNMDMKLGWMVPYSHNGFLDIWIQMGFLGLLVLFIMLFVTCKYLFFCLRVHSSGYTRWCGGLLLLTFLYNIDEGTLLGANELCWVLFVLACAGITAEAASIRANGILWGSHRQLPDVVTQPAYIPQPLGASF